MKDKELLREEIWNHLKENELTIGGFNYGRIPKFKGVLKAAMMLRILLSGRSLMLYSPVLIQPRSRSKNMPSEIVRI